jgi:catechol 2,3-dioxygenase-like lactoylglutathione lyase family enzyme
LRADEREISYLTQIAEECVNGRVEALFHPVVAASDLQATVAYFRDLLGLAVTFEAAHDPAAIAGLFSLDSPAVDAVVVSCPDGSEIELVQLRSEARPVAQRRPFDPGLMAINLLVRDVDPIVERLTAGGYPPRSPIVTQTLPDGAAIRVVVCRAPDDVVIILVELPAGRTSLAG